MIKVKNSKNETGGREGRAGSQFSTEKEIRGVNKLHACKTQNLHAICTDL